MKYHDSSQSVYCLAKEMCDLIDFKTLANAAFIYLYTYTHMHNMRIYVYMYYVQIFCIYTHTFRQ